jgi:hypothetical protein
MVGLLCRDNGSKGSKREVNAREAVIILSRDGKVVDAIYSRNKVGLEFVQIDIKGSIKPE